MHRWLFVIVALALTLPACAQQNSPNRQAGVYIATAYNYDIDSSFYGAFGPYTFTRTACTNAVSLGTRALDPFNVNASVLVTDSTPANTETVAFVSQNLNGGLCILSLAVTHAHVSYHLSSGTYGLQEAINDATQNGGGNIVLDSKWHGTTAMITGSAGNTLVSITDNRTGSASYIWNGSNYVLVPIGGAPGGSNAQLQINNSGAFGAIANVAAGSTLVSGAPPVFQSKPVIDVRDITGVDCTGATDSAAALTAFTGNPPTTNNAITQRTLSFGNCLSIKLASTWTIYNQAGFIISGMTRSGAASKGVHVTWSGAASGTMIDMEYVDGFQVEGLFVDGGSNATTGINVDKTGAGGIWNTTDGRFVNDTYNGSNANWVGLKWSAVSTQNVEDMRSEDSTFYCGAPAATTAGVGILIGNSANAKNEIIKHNNFSLCLYGIWKKNGSMHVSDSEFSANGGTCATGSGADIRDDGNTDVDTIEGNLDENSLQGIRGGNMGFPVIVRGNHAAPAGCENTSVYWYNTGSGTNPWTFEGNSWDVDSNLINVVGSATGVQGQNIYTSGNTWPNSVFNPWWTTSITPANSNDLGLLSDRIFSYGVQTGGIPSSGNYESPFLSFRGYFNGSTSNPDDFALQNIPASTAGTSGGTFLIKHQQGATGNELFGWDGSYPGVNVLAMSTPATPTISNIGTPGSSSYTYAVIAYTSLGNTPASSTVNTATGAATLNTTNYNQLSFVSVAGATKYCIWRTASTGTPSSLGNIGCISALQVNFRNYPNVWGTAYALNNAGVRNAYLFNDTGLAGDSATLPSANSTGAVWSVLAQAGTDGVSTPGTATLQAPSTYALQSASNVVGTLTNTANQANNGPTGNADELTVIANINPASNSLSYFAGSATYAITPSANSATIFEIDGAFTETRANGSGAVGLMIGADTEVFNEGSAVTGDQRGTYSESAILQSSGASVNTGVWAQAGSGSSGTVAINRGVFIDLPSSIGSGTITHNYGLYVGDQSAASADTWAIWTNGGNLHFNGQLQTPSTSTASAPDYSFIGSGNAGMYLATTDTVGIASHGTSLAQFDFNYGETLTDGDCLGFSNTGLASGRRAGICNPGTGIFTFGNATINDTSGTIKTAAYMSVGTKFTSNGGCTEGTLVGGATAGKFTVGQNTACTIVITMGNSASAPNGWTCHYSDETAVPAVAIRQTGSNATTASLLMTVATSDVVSFGCTGY
jgi:hypothetical protein